MRGEIVLEATDEGVRIVCDDGTVATIDEPRPDSGRWATVRATDGEEYGLGLPDDDPDSGWTVSRDGAPVLSSRVGMSSKGGLPVTVDIEAGGEAYRVAAGPEWRTWSVSRAGHPVGEVTDTDEFALRLDEEVPLPVVVVVAANALIVADARQRPWFLAARRMERRTREKLEKRHGSAVDGAAARGHEVRYLSAWEDSIVKGWFECLRCGRTASTFESVGKDLAKSALGLGTAGGRLAGDLLTDPCDAVP